MPTPCTPCHRVPIIAGYVYIMWAEAIVNPTIRITRFTARGFKDGDLMSGSLGGGIPIWEDSDPWEYTGHPGGAFVITPAGHMYGYHTFAQAPLSFN